MEIKQADFQQVRRDLSEIRSFVFEQLQQKDPEAYEQLLKEIQNKGEVKEKEKNGNTNSEEI